MENPFETPIPNVYFNGFKMSVNVGDVTITLSLDGEDVAVLHASYNVAKTFGDILQGAISNLEKKVGKPVLSLNELAETLVNEPARDKS